jgi:hypothetical protein
LLSFFPENRDGSIDCLFWRRKEKIEYIIEGKTAKITTRLVIPGYRLFNIPDNTSLDPGGQ